MHGMARHNTAAWMHTCINAWMQTYLDAYMHRAYMHHAYMHGCINAWMQTCIHAMPTGRPADRPTCMDRSRHICMYTCMHAYRHHSGPPEMDERWMAAKRPCYPSTHIHASHVHPYPTVFLEEQRAHERARARMLANIRTRLPARPPPTRPPAHPHAGTCAHEYTNTCATYIQAREAKGAPFKKRKEGSWGEVQGWRPCVSCQASIQIARLPTCIGKLRYKYAYGVCEHKLVYPSNILVTARKGNSSTTHAHLLACSHR